MKFAPISQPSLVDEVAIRIRKLVETGKLRAGDRLPSEPEMVGGMKVSRTVLREAIGRLEAIGILTVRRGRGTYVADTGTLTTATQLIRSALAISPHDLMRVLDLRRCIEVQCAGRAAKLASDMDIADLDALYQRMTETGGDFADNMKTDFEFHLRIIQIDGNELMVNVMRVIQDFIFAGMVQTLEQPGIPLPPHDLHREMLEAIRARDPRRAEKAVAAHMDLVEARLQFVAAKADIPGGIQS